MGSPKGPRPLSWKYPNDKIRTDKHRGFLRARAQWNFRNEGCEISTEQWQDIWPDDLWSQRGRGPGNICIIRDDPKEIWSVLNIMIVTRRLQLIIQKYPVDMYQMPNGVWDITGDTLKKWERNQKRTAAYKDKYRKTPKEKGL
jgi:hypothetical protein